MNKTGLTLIELLVIISIVGVLATIAVPTLRGFSTVYSFRNENNRQVVCKSRFGTECGATLTNCLDNQEYYCVKNFEVVKGK